MCLSILGTWPGKPGEECSVPSIQPLIYRAIESGFPIRSYLHPLPHEPRSGTSLPLPRIDLQYKNEPGYEDYDKPSNNPPTPVATPPIGTNAPATSGATAPVPATYFQHMHRTIGKEKEAKLYIRKIRHETIRISVIQRLEEYLNTNQSVIENVDGATAANSDDDDDDDGETRRPASPEPLELGMWHDRCKHLFLWYYDIYLVSPHFNYTY